MGLAALGKVKATFSSTLPYCSLVSRKGRVDTTVLLLGGDGYCHCLESCFDRNTGDTECPIPAAIYGWY